MSIHLDHVRPSNHPIHRPLSAVLLAAALAIVVASSLTAVVPSAWTAFKDAYQSQQPDLAQCALIATGSERLACFDQLAKQALQPPAKGADAPLVALSAARKGI